MTTRRRLTVKAQGPDARATFSLEAYKGKVWITAYDCPHVCVAILEPGQADNLVELVNQTSKEAREMAEAERLTRNASKTVDELDLTLHQALTVASTCREQYLAAPPHIRRQINQGFFTRLLIAPDGSVERAELTEPFATLLADTSHEAVGCAQDAPDVSGAVPATEAPSSMPRHASGARGVAGHGPTNVLVRTFEKDQKPSGDLVAAGVKEAGLVPPAGFEPATHGLGTSGKVCRKRPFENLHSITGKVRPSRSSTSTGFKHCSMAAPSSRITETCNGAVARNLPRRPGRRPVIAPASRRSRASRR